jgi:hypothetical protein
MQYEDHENTSANINPLGKYVLPKQNGRLLFEMLNLRHPNRIYSFLLNLTSYINQNVMNVI